MPKICASGDCRHYALICETKAVTEVIIVVRRKSSGQPRIRSERSRPARTINLETILIDGGFAA